MKIVFHPIGFYLSFLVHNFAKSSGPVFSSLFRFYFKFFF